MKNLFLVGLSATCIVLGFFLLTRPTIYSDFPTNTFGIYDTGTNKIYTNGKHYIITSQTIKVYEFKNMSQLYSYDPWTEFRGMAKFKYEIIKSSDTVCYEKINCDKESK